MTKYRAKPVVMTEDGTMFEIKDIKDHNLDIEGVRFDSKMEAEYYQILKGQLARGEIQAITLQPIYILQDNPRITYKADFEVMHHGGDPETIDVKGVETTAFKMKKKLFAKVCEDYKLTLITKYNGRWRNLEDLKKEKRQRKAAEQKLLKRAKP